MSRNKLIKSLEQTQAWTALKSRDKTIQLSAAKAVKKFAEDEKNGLALEQWIEFCELLYKRVLDLINSGSAHICTGGIFLMEELLDLPTDSTENIKVQRFKKAIDLLFEQSKADKDNIRLATRALGHLVKAAGPLSTKLLEDITGDCRNYLSDAKHENKRLAAVWILRELALNVPTLLSSNLPSVMRLLWNPIHDPKLSVREAGVRALRECFVLVLRRPQAFRVQFEDTFSRVHQSIGIEAKDALLSFNSKHVNNSKAKSKPDNEIHGGLLIFGELLKCADFILADKWDSMYATTLSFRHHKSRHVKRAVIDLIPSLAKFAPTKTKHNKFLKESVEYLISMCNDKEFQESCFTSLGDLALAVGPQMQPYLRNILNILQKSLAGSSLDKITFDSALKCISCLVAGVGGDELQTVLSPLLKHMFSGGLSPTLVETLKNICDNITELKQNIHHQLAHEIWNILSNEGRSAFQHNPQLATDSSQKLDDLIKEALQKEKQQNQYTESHRRIQMNRRDKNGRNNPKLVNSNSNSQNSRGKPETPDDMYSDSSDSDNMEDFGLEFSNAIFAAKKNKRPSKQLIASSRALRHHLHLSKHHRKQPGNEKDAREVHTRDQGYFSDDEYVYEYVYENVANDDSYISGKRIGMTGDSEQLRNELASVVQLNKKRRKLRRVRKKTPVEIELQYKNDGSEDSESKQSESAKSVSISTNVTIKPHRGANIHITSASESVTTQLVSSYSADSNPGNGGPGGGSNENLLGSPFATSTSTNSNSLIGGALNRVRSYTGSAQQQLAAFTRFAGGHSSSNTSSSDANVVVTRHHRNSFVHRRASRVNAKSNSQLTEDQLRDSTVIYLALKSLADFELDTIFLLPFIKIVGQLYLEDPDPMVRRQASWTLSLLLLRLLKSIKHKKHKELEYRHKSSVVSDVLERLLIVGVCDPAPVIRATVLSSFTHEFDHYLSQNEALQTLFWALNDEIFAVRQVVLQILGRLAIRNPGQVMPHLRKTLIQLLTELQNSIDVRLRQQSAELLGTLIESLHGLVQPYVSAMANVLLPKLKESEDLTVEICILSTIGKLSEIAGPRMTPYLDQLLPLILKFLNDKFSLKRKETALHSLGQLIQNTQCVIEPYVRYKSLLTTILSCLNSTNQSWQIRREAMRVLGIVGALDPFLHKVNERAHAIQKRNQNQANNGLLTAVDDISLEDRYHVIIDDHKKETSHSYFNTSVAIGSLVKMLSDSGLQSYHSEVTRAVLAVLKNSKDGAEPFLPIVLPVFLANMRKTKEFQHKNRLIRSLQTVIDISGPYISKYLDGIFKIIHDYWNEDQRLQEALLSLIQSISNALGVEFKVYLTDLVPLLLRILHTDNTKLRQPTINVLHALETFGVSLEDHLYLIIPPLMRLCELRELNLSIRRKCIQSIRKLCQSVNFSAYCSNVIHPLIRIIDGDSLELRNEACLTLCALLVQMGPDYAIFIPTIDKILKKHNYTNETYKSLVDKLITNELSVNAADYEQKQEFSSGISGIDNYAADALRGTHHLTIGDWDDPHSRKLSSLDSLHGSHASLDIRQRWDAIVRRWDPEQAFSKEDWFNWLRSLQQELLKQSPDVSLRICAGLAARYQQLAEELFNAAFYACWTELDDVLQDELTRAQTTAFEQALTRPGSVPNAVLITLLNLTEFMERQGHPLLVMDEKLGQVAELCHAYAKALYYKEKQFRLHPQDTFQSLMSIHNRLQHMQAAEGIVEYSKTTEEQVQLDASWFEKLNRWEDALDAYERGQLADRNDIDATLGRMRCLRALGHWQRLQNLAKKTWIKYKGIVNQINSMIQRGGAKGANNSGSSLKQGSLQREKSQDSKLASVSQTMNADIQNQIFEKTEAVATLGAVATWHCGNFMDMERFVRFVDEKHADGAFFRAILATRRYVLNPSRRTRDIAMDWVDHSREALDVDMTTLVGESYNRAYDLCVRSLQLAEVEEILTLPELPVDMWTSRLMGCKQSDDVWQEILSIRALVRDPKDDLHTWLKFSALCRKNDRLVASLSILCKLIDREPSYCDSLFVKKKYSQFHGEIKDARISFAFAQHYFSAGYEDHATDFLLHIAEQLKYRVNSQGNGPRKSIRRKQTLQNQVMSDDEDSYFSDSSLSLMNGSSYNGMNGLNAMNNTHGSNSRVNSKKSKKKSLDNELRKLTANCYIKLGLWTQDLSDDLNDDTIAQALDYFEEATKFNPNSYWAWHDLAIMHYEAINRNSKDKERIKVHLVPAVHAFFKSIALDEHGASNDDDDQLVHRKIKSSSSNPLMNGVLSLGNGDMSRNKNGDSNGNNSENNNLPADASAHYGTKLQDILRLLHVWFNHADNEDAEVKEAILTGFNQVPIETWLPVIPQIIARLQTATELVLDMIKDVLINIGKKHPQALVYPLAVVFESASSDDKKAIIETVLDRMREHSPSLVKEAFLVSQELIRCAILWDEMWYEKLEEASRVYFGNKNTDVMFTELSELHEMMMEGPKTYNEMCFQQVYGRNLQEASEWVQRFGRTQNESDLNQAWEYYASVFRTISKALPNLTHLELQYVSPELYTAEDLDLAIPGTYLESVQGSKFETPVSIFKFNPHLKVMESKQRPRKLTMLGNDGKEYGFLLKGHEDLRLDERVMQLFNLVNTLLANDDQTRQLDLLIRSYNVIPLSPTSGILEWMDHCETIHGLIKDYRAMKKIVINIENRLMGLFCPDHTNLTAIAKVEVFEHALKRTSGNDLAEMLWLRSHNAEKWLERRTEYTRSLAVMSMVGYILGLGDRHPSNLMLHKYMGKLIHIDFGDCFEVAMQRDKFPERFPFRLTRMLVRAMEVSGIEGNFRITCQHVMRVLRDNKESIQAVLEAFAYDPLINWQLFNEEETGDENKDSKSARRLKKVASIKQMASMTQAQIRAQMQQAAAALHRKGGSIIPQFPTADRKVSGQNIVTTNSSSANNRILSLDDSISETFLAQFEAFGDELNEKAVAVLKRVSQKLRGKDFEDGKEYDVNEQVSRLIFEATSRENLCQAYLGWCPLW